MKSFVFALCALGLWAGASTPALAASRNFDCSKPANANKTACKTAAKAAPAPAKAAPAKDAATKPAPKAVAAKTTTTKTVTRSYDCTKAGNKNKAQCKGTTSVATSVTKPAPAPAAQPGILQRMKNAMTGSSAPAAKPAPKAAPRKTAAAAPASVEDHNPAGAIAQCKDGTYSHAKARSGACARHGGVAKWS